MESNFTADEALEQVRSARAAQALPGTLVWGVVLAVAAWVSTIVLGRRFDEALRADIRAGGADVMMSA